MPPSQAGVTIVSLTTDFGLSDPFVGIVKAQILLRCPQVHLVDLTHAIAAQRVEEAAFWLERSWRHFPEGTLHLVVVDPGVGSARGVLAVAVGGQLFLGPDNGALGGLASLAGAAIRTVAPGTLERLGLAAPSATFHGRDVFAPLAGELAAGRISFEELGSPATTWAARPGQAAEAGPEGVTGRVLLVDRFGNCFSNIEANLISGHEVRTVHFGGHPLPLVRTYADRPPGTDIALVNAFGVLEAARVQGHAARSLGLGPDSPVHVGWPGRAPGRRPG